MLRRATRSRVSNEDRNGALPGGLRGGHRPRIPFLKARPRLTANVATGRHRVSHARFMAWQMAAPWAARALNCYPSTSRDAPSPMAGRGGCRLITRLPLWAPDRYGGFHPRCGALQVTY